MRKLTRLILPGLVFLCAVLALPQTPSRAQDRPRLLVFAAVSLTDSLQEVGVLYEEQSGNEVVFSFAGSMTLARQIEASSGADIFISADVDSMDYLEIRELIVPATRHDLLANELVLVAPADSTTMLSIRPGFPLADALSGGRLAVANTVTVPAGRYAQAALESLGVWETVANALAEGEDVRAALAFVARGEAPLGIVYATDAAVEPRVRIVARFPASSHAPIRYPAALTREAHGEATEFLRFLRRDAAREVFETAGFTALSPPGP